MDNSVLTRAGGFEFHLKETDVIRDGHVYCSVCGEQVDGKDMEILGHPMTLRIACRCEREREAERKRQERRQRVRMLKDGCFNASQLANCQLDAFYQQDNPALLVAKNYVRHFDQMRGHNVGLLFYGDVGCGKTFLACAIANALIEHDLIYARYKNLGQLISDLGQHAFDEERKKILQQMRDIPLLILDDVGIERDTSYTKEQVYTLINERYLGGHPTIFTTNLSLKTMENAAESMDDRRIYSRILEMGIPVQVTGEDVRSLIRKQKLKQYGSLLKNGGERP